MSEVELTAASSRGRRWAEIGIVLGLSLGASAVYSVVELIDNLTRGPLSGQTTTLNPSQSDRAVFDLIYQLLSIATSLMPVLLVCFLLWSRAKPHLGRLGIDARHPVRDGAWGVGLALAMGAGGLVVYFGGEALGLTVAVDPAGIGGRWWTVPVLLLSAFRSGAQEEFIVVGYLFARLGELGWRGRWIVLAAALLRGTYHLYQGPSAFIGNALLGLVFGTLYLRAKRLWPLVIAHSLIDAAVFVGYPLAAPLLRSWGLLG